MAGGGIPPEMMGMDPNAAQRPHEMPPELMAGDPLEGLPPEVVDQIMAEQAAAQDAMPPEMQPQA